MGSKYKKIKMPDGGTIDEHRFIMQVHIGRKLEFNEVVHHLNGDKQDNRIENLQLMQRSQHSKIHQTGISFISSKGLEKLRDAGIKNLTGAKINAEMARQIKILLLNISACIYFVVLLRSRRSPPAINLPISISSVSSGFVSPTIFPS